MEAQFCAANVKTLQNALLCLNKLGESLNLQVSQSIVSTSQHSTGQPVQGSGPHTETTVRLTAINSTSSAFCAFILAQDFFDSITVGNPDDSSRHSSRSRSSSAFASASSGQSHKLECQVNIRSLLASLKNNTTGGRKLERCELSISDGGVECRLSVRLHYQHGVTKTHRLTYEAQQAVFPSANPDPGSALAVSAQTVQEWLLHFAATGRGADISLWCDPDFCTVRSKSDDFETGKVRKSIQTEVKVELDQFQLYQVNAEAYLTLPLREFKAAVTVSESLLAPLELHFSVGGEPLFLRMWADSVTFEMVIATTDTKPPEMTGTLQGPPAPRTSATSATTPIRSAARPSTGVTTSQHETQTQIQAALQPQRQPSSAASVPSSSKSYTQDRASMVTESQLPVPEPEPITRQSQLPVHSTPAPRRAVDNTLDETRDTDSRGGDAGRSSQHSLSDTLFRGEVSASQEHSRSMPPPSVLPARRIARPQGAASVPPLQTYAEDESGIADADDGSFDYGGAFDEMEQGIQDGRIHVHGSQADGGEGERERTVRTSITLEAENGLLASSQPPPDESVTVDEEEDTVPCTQQSGRSTNSHDGGGQKRFRPMFG